MKIAILYWGKISLIFLMLSVSPLTTTADELSATAGLAKEWGQLMLCQRIYRMPEVKPRLYDFDVEQCNSAELAIMDVVSRNDVREQNTIKLQAERHARSLSYNTSEPYHSVPACREYCKSLAQSRDIR